MDVDERVLLEVMLVSVGEGMFVEDVVYRDGVLYIDKILY